MMMVYMTITRTLIRQVLWKRLKKNRLIERRVVPEVCIPEVRVALMDETPGGKGKEVAMEKNENEVITLPDSKYFTAAM